MNSVFWKGHFTSGKKTKFHAKLIQHELPCLHHLRLKGPDTLGLNVTRQRLTETFVQSCSVKKVFLEISQNSQEFAGLRPATLLKKRLWHRCFPVNFVKFLKTLFFTEHL